MGSKATYRIVKDLPDGDKVRDTKGLIDKLPECKKYKDFKIGKEFKISEAE